MRALLDICNEIDLPVMREFVGLDYFKIFLAYTSILAYNIYIIATGKLVVGLVERPWPYHGGDNLRLFLLFSARK
jgi:hypothetical protein